MRVSHQHVYDSLAHMLSAGVSLKPALLTSVAQGSGALPAAVTAVANVIERGSALAAAIAGHPKVFPRFDIAVVEIAEMSGRLPLLFQGRTTIEYLFLPSFPRCFIHSCRRLQFTSSLNSVKEVIPFSECLIRPCWQSPFWARHCTILLSAAIASDS